MKKKKILLLIDAATAHTDEVILKRLRKLNVQYLIIPAGQTCQLQPVDLGINSTVKREFAFLYNQRLVKSNGNEAKISREFFLNDMVLSWLKLERYTIKKSWDRAEIYNT